MENLRIDLDQLNRDAAMIHYGPQSEEGNNLQFLAIDNEEVLWCRVFRADLKDLPLREWTHHKQVAELVRFAMENQKLRSLSVPLVTIKKGSHD